VPQPSQAQYVVVEQPLTAAIDRSLGPPCLQVRAASHIKTNEPVAIKIISRARMQEEKGAEDKGESLHHGRGHGICSGGSRRLVDRRIHSLLHGCQIGSQFLTKIEPDQDRKFWCCDSAAGDRHHAAAAPPAHRPPVRGHRDGAGHLPDHGVCRGMLASSKRQEQATALLTAACRVGAGRHLT
jgi:hypothetical protein